MAFSTGILDWLCKDFSTGLMFILTFVVCILLHRIFWSRKKYTFPLPPSPTFRLPVIGHMHLLKKDMREPLRKFRQQLGDIYCIYFGSRPVIIISGYKTLKESFLKNGEAFENRPAMFLLDKMLRGTSLAQQNDDPWREHRRFALSTLKDLGMGRSKLEARMLEEAERVIQAFRKAKGEPFDPKIIVQTSVSNIICFMLFGVIFDNGDPRFARMIEMFDVIISSVTGIVNFMPWLCWLPGDPFGAHRSIKTADEIFKYAYDVITSHIDDVTTDEDYIHSYIREMKRLQEAGTPTSLSIDNLAGSFVDLFIAGSETTSTALRWALVCMLEHPETQDRLFMEIKEQIGTDRPPSVQDRTKMPYVEAFYMETLRYCNLSLSPGIHATKVDTEFYGYTIPADAVLMPDLDSVFRDPEIWGDPESFRPERFLDNNGRLLRKEEFVAFFLGKRSCIGESLARTELFLFLTSIVQRFHITPAPGETVSMANTDGNFGIVHSPKPFSIVAHPR